MATEEEAIEALGTDILAEQLKHIEICVDFTGYGTQVTERAEGVVAIYVSRPEKELSNAIREAKPDHVELPTGVKVPVRFFNIGDLQPQ